MHSIRLSPAATESGKRAALSVKGAAAKRSKTSDELPLLTAEQIAACTTLEQPKLPFDLATAREHLCAADVRFQALFAQMDLTVYEELCDGHIRELNLFRVLSTSILGQQISWLAARSILFKFCRLFAPHLPEKPDFSVIKREELPFPTPLDVLGASDEQLRSAGLSTAKVKYIRDIARRFADGRLDVRRIVHMSYDECIAELTQVKGVGRSTAEMLLMFALRRPDVLPVGDLGVQRGMLLFHLAGATGPVLSEHKRRRPYDGPGDVDVPALPMDLSLAVLRSRSQGHKKKNAYLDEPEMQALTARWAPYRSVGCMFMWHLIDA